MNDKSIFTKSYNSFFRAANQSLSRLQSHIALLEPGRPSAPAAVKGSPGIVTEKVKED